MEVDENKYKGKYRLESTRLQNWNYGWNAVYFVTICTKDRIHYFGEIADGKMIFSPIGAIADVMWHELKYHFNNIELDAFVVMPNHIHGIIVIKNVNADDNGVTSHTRDDFPHIWGDLSHTVETTHALSLQSHLQPHLQSHLQSHLQPHQSFGQQRFQHQGSKTLSSIVGSYKSAVSRHVHRLGYDFVWQSRFYDVIIRNDIALNRIQKYINNNPVNWKKDIFHLF